MLNYRKTVNITFEGLLLIYFLIMIKKWLFLKNIPLSRLEYKLIPYLYPSPHKAVPFPVNPSSVRQVEKNKLTLGLLNNSLFFISSTQKV